ncbi:MAG: redoxin domain-containing protein [Promethearchaeota archaeon]
MPIEGDNAPDFSGHDFINDVTFTLSDHLGKIILLSFVNIGCSHCNNEVPCLVELWDKYKNHGIQIVAVHAGFWSTTEADAKAWLESFGVTFPAIHDPATFTAYMVGVPSNERGVPHCFIIDRNMIIRKRYVGFHSCDVLEGLLLDVVYMRDPVDIELVMDVSDSMNSPSPSNLVGDTKFTMMKQASTIITDFLKENGQIDDRMGLVWFTDDVSEYKNSNDEKLLPIPANWAELRAQINSHQTGICTAMGSGLQAAFDTLSTSNQKRFIILCTDGIQNIEPLVKKVGDHYEIIDGDGWCGPHSQIVAAHPGINITSYNTCVHTIGIGITANYEALLQEIADETQTFYLGTNDPDTDLDFLYFVDLCNCMAGGSPSILFHNISSLCVEENEKIETFYINSTIRKITVILSWKASQNSNFTFWLYSPDGTLLDLHNEMRLYENHCLAAIYLPKLQDGEELSFKGEWRMIIHGEISGRCADYHAFVIGEDTKIKYKVDFLRKYYSVGDLLTLKIKLLKDKKPIFILPRDIHLEIKYLPIPLPELLSEYKISPNELYQKTTIKTKSFPKNPLILKLNSLIFEPLFQKRLIPTRKQLSLQEGNLKCKIEKEEIFLPLILEQPGLHSFKIKTRFEDQKDGPIYRTTMVSIIVGPGEADPKYTKTNIIDIATEKLKGKIINITPRNKNGQLLGPGYSQNLKLLVDKKELDVNFNDLLDGTYQIELSESKKEILEIKEKSLKLYITFQKILIWEGILYP